MGIDVTAVALGIGVGACYAFNAWIAMAALIGWIVYRELEA